MPPILATIDPYILAFSAVTVFATLFMGFWTARKSKTASDFFVAGRSVSVGWNASAISGEYLSAASFMGVAGMVMSSGYDALWYPVCYACGYLFLLLFIAGPLRRFGAYTIPDFAEGRFDSPVFRKIAVCFVLFIGFFYTMPQMKGAGTTLAYIFPGLPYWAGVVLVGAVITLNVALGGMKGITLVQAVQYWAKMFAISVPIFVLMAVYGGYGKQLGANGSEVQAPPKVWFNPENYPAEFVKSGGTNRTITYPSKASEVRSKAARFGLGTVPIPSPNSSIPLVVLVMHYMNCLPSLGDDRVEYYHRTVSMMTPIDTSALPLPQSQSASTIRQYYERIWATNGLTIVQVDRDAIAIVRTKNLSRFVNKTPDSAESRAPLSWNTNSFIEVRSAKELQADAIRNVNRQLTPSNLSGQVDTIVTEAQTRLPVSFSFDPVSQQIHRLRALLAHYRDASGAKMFLFKELSDIPVEFAPAAKLSASEFIKLADFVLKTNNIIVLRHESTAQLVIPSEQAASYSATNDLEVRKPLPEKAPKDETWLSPFGPLTTKAAKAAKLSAEESKPYSLLYTYSLIIALVCGTAGLPHILVRFYTNPDGVAAKRTTMWVMILIGIFYVFPPVFGVMGRNLFPELYSGIGAKGTDKIVLELPRLLNEKYAPLGSILSGITCAGAFAAFMSTFSGLLVSMTGAMAHDVYGRMLRPKSTPNERMRMFKVFAVVLGGVAMLLGSFVEPLEINFMVGQAFAIAAASYFPLLFMAVWWRQLTMKGAATGMLVGGLSAVVAISLTSFSVLALAPGPSGELFAMFKPLNAFWAGHPLLRILCEQPAIWAVPLAIGLMIVVSKLTRKEVPSDIRMKMLVLHAPEKLGLKQEYIQEHQPGH